MNPIDHFDRVNEYHYTLDSTDGEWSLEKRFGVWCGYSPYDDEPEIIGGPDAELTAKWLYEVRGSF